MAKKRITVLLGVILSWAWRTMSFGAEPPQTPLNVLTFNLNGAASTRPSTYDWRSVRHRGTTEESSEYGSIVTTTMLKKGDMVLHDKITVAPKNLPDTPKNFSWVFDRTTVFAADNLLVPRVITIDMSAGGQTVRQFSYENGTAKDINESGEHGTAHLDFSKGILTDDALLRLTPLLPRIVGSVYTFKQYAEPLLFLVHTADNSDPVFTLRCELVESIQIRDRPRECFKFIMELKSAVIEKELWVDKTSNVVVKFVDVLPKGAEADFMEATLQE